MCIEKKSLIFHHYLTFDLNSDNKFDITERDSYKNMDKSPDHFDGTSVFFDIHGYGSFDVTSFNFKTGQYKKCQLEACLENER